MAAFFLRAFFLRDFLAIGLLHSVRGFVARFFPGES